VDEEFKRLEKEGQVIAPKVTLPHNCGQSEKLVKELEEDCHGITKKEVYPGI
jgi:hypothetical protein